jgi:hypothetical protein
VSCKSVGHAFRCRFRGISALGEVRASVLKMSYPLQSDIPILGSTHNPGANHSRMRVSGRGSAGPHGWQGVSSLKVQLAGGSATCAICCLDSSIDAPVTDKRLEDVHMNISAIMRSTPS